ncbi:MAG: class I SAM-dependent methyltransferase [Deinococcales bacterium]
MPPDLSYTFNAAAQDYHLARPQLPEQAVEMVLAYAKSQHPSFTHDSHIFEVGCGSGQATLPFAKRGFKITAIDMGEQLVQLARQSLAAYPKVEILHQRFEDFRAVSDVDLFLSVQAFHWIDSPTGLTKAVEFLKTGGVLALIWHLDCSEETAFYKATSPIYARYKKLMLAARPTPAAGKEKIYQALQQHCHFKDLAVKRFSWQQQHDKKNFLSLLRSFSNHAVLADTAFYQEIAFVIDDFGGQVTTLYETAILLATKV